MVSGTRTELVRLKFCLALIGALGNDNFYFNLIAWLTRTRITFKQKSLLLKQPVTQ